MYKKSVKSRQELNEILDALDVLELDYNVNKTTVGNEENRFIPCPHSWSVEVITKGNSSKTPQLHHVNINLTSEISCDEAVDKIVEFITRSLSRSQVKP